MKMHKYHPFTESATHGQPKNPCRFLGCHPVQIADTEVSWLQPYRVFATQKLEVQKLAQDASQFTISVF